MHADISCPLCGSNTVVCENYGIDGFEINSAARFRVNYKCMSCGSLFSASANAFKNGNVGILERGILREVERSEISPLGKI